MLRNPSALSSAFPALRIQKSVWLSVPNVAVDPNDIQPDLAYDNGGREKTQSRKTKPYPLSILKTGFACSDEKDKRTEKRTIE